MPDRAYPALDLSAQRRLLLHRQGLLEDPGASATPAALHRLVDRLGFVQLDSIHVVARGHDLILAARLDAYEPGALTALVEKPARLFEHWTHDASVLPLSWFAPWRHRCRRMVSRPWLLEWVTRRVGPDWQKTVARVLDRIRADGPLMSRDFAHAADGGRSGPWWGWKPAKAALEYLFWRGDLTIAARRNFQKVYDLTERHLPQAVAEEAPSEEAYRDWACAEALQRLVVATPREIRDFHNAVSAAEVEAWGERSAGAGRVRRVALADRNGKPPRLAYALRDWRRQLQRAETALASVEDRIRWLSPFDPVVRDRKRLERLFGFRYRFEAFVPAAKREYGYYVLPLLRGEEFVGRVDAKHHRKECELEIKGVWWEDGRGRTKEERRLLEESLERLAIFVGADWLRY